MLYIRLVVTGDVCLVATGEILRLVTAHDLCYGWPLIASISYTMHNKTNYTEAGIVRVYIPIAHPVAQVMAS